MNRTCTGAAIAALLAAPGQGALALGHEEPGPPLDWTGTALHGSLGYGGYRNDRLDFDDTASAHIDLEGRYVFPNGLGVEAAFEQRRSPEGDPDSEFGAALTFLTGQHQFAFGAPSPAIDILTPGVALGDNPTLAGTQFNRLYYNSIRERQLADDDPVTPGLRYLGDFGPLKVGASYHRFQDTDDAAYSIAARYEVTPDLRLGLGLEDGDGYEAPAVRVTADAGFGPAGVGVNHFRRVEGGRDVLGTYLVANYELTTGLLASAFLFRKSVGSVQTEDIRGLAVTYALVTLANSPSAPALSLGSNPFSGPSGPSLPGSATTTLVPELTLGFYRDRLTDEDTVTGAFRFRF